MNTYTETVYPFRVLRHEELPEEHKASLRLNGIDPDDNWSLIWSFQTREAAENQLKWENENKAEWQTFKLVEGELEEIERPVW